MPRKSLLKSFLPRFASTSSGSGRDPPRGRRKRWYKNIPLDPLVFPPTSGAGISAGTGYGPIVGGRSQSSSNSSGSSKKFFDAWDGMKSSGKKSSFHLTSPFSQSLADYYGQGQNQQSGKNSDQSKKSNGPMNSPTLDAYFQFMNSTVSGATKKKVKTIGLSLSEAGTLQEHIDTLESLLSKSNPRQIRDYLDEHIIGQDRAKQSMACAVYNHYSRVYHNLVKKKESLDDFPSKPAPMLEKSNILLLGPSGSGKTLMAKKIADTLKLPFSMNDATTFTQAGYVGDDVEQSVARLLQAARSDVKKAEVGIVFIDEIDKISKRSDSSVHSVSRDIAGEGVQQALLKMLEGTTVYVQDKSKKGEAVAVDTSNILFILSGAFVGMDRVIQDRMKGTRSMGFGAKVSGPIKIDYHEALEDVRELDLIRYGLIPEFVGRVPIIVPVQKLQVADLVRILIEPKNSLTHQFKELFATWNVKLTFDEGSLNAIAQCVMDRSTGARGLRFALEELLKEAMYLAPGSTIQSIHIDDSLRALYQTPDSAFTMDTPLTAEIVRREGRTEASPVSATARDVIFVSPTELEKTTAAPPQPVLKKKGD